MLYEKTDPIEQLNNLSQYSTQAIVWNVQETLRHILLQQKTDTSACGKLCEDLAMTYKLIDGSTQIVYLNETLYYYF